MRSETGFLIYFLEEMEYSRIWILIKGNIDIQVEFFKFMLRKSITRLNVFRQMKFILK